MFVKVSVLLRVTVLLVLTTSFMAGLTIHR